MAISASRCMARGYRKHAVTAFSLPYGSASQTLALGPCSASLRQSEPSAAASAGSRPKSIGNAPIAGVALSVDASSMTTLVRSLPHPQLRIDAAVRLYRAMLVAIGFKIWSLQDGLGDYTNHLQRRAQAFKTAQPIAAALGVDREIREARRENDRVGEGLSATERIRKLS
jgi:hypothetical protein